MHDQAAQKQPYASLIKGASRGVHGSSVYAPLDQWIIIISSGHALYRKLCYVQDLVLWLSRGTIHTIYGLDHLTARMPHGHANTDAVLCAPSSCHDSLHAASTGLLRLDGPTVALLHRVAAVNSKPPQGPTPAPHLPPGPPAHPVGGKRI